MEAYSDGVARIRHHETGRIYEIERDILDWEVVGSDERQMGPEFHHEAVLEHPELGKIAWGLWEYPIGLENYRKTDAGPHDVLEDLDYGLLHTKDDGDEWFEPPPSDDPFTAFMSSYHGSSDLLARRRVLLQFNLVGIWNAGMDNRWRVKIRAYHCAQHSWNPAKPNPGNAPRLKHNYECEQPRSAGSLNQQFD